MLGYFTRFLQESPSWIFVLLWLCFLAFSLFLRYGMGYMPLSGGFVFYAVPYFITLCLYSIFSNDWVYWQASGFWVVSLGILGVLYLNQYIHFSQLLGLETNVSTRAFVHKIGYNVQCTCLYLLVPVLYGVWANELKTTSFYGLQVGKMQLSPYFLMLLGMLPLLVWASFRADFLATYPRYRPSTAEVHWGISSYWTVGSYELSYVLQFISLEIFFRGFIVLALAVYVGKASVFVMVSVYAFLHFWKPMPETVGSIAGGYILGVIAYQSRSVYGGMIVHVGIALMMEFLAWWQLTRKE